TQAATACRSSTSPRPSSNVPSDSPVPRKLKRTVVAPSSRIARAAIVTTLLCIVPPSVGSGWQTMPTSGSAATSSSGRSTCSSSAPAGPAMVTGPEASGNGGSVRLAMRGMIGACAWPRTAVAVALRSIRAGIRRSCPALQADAATIAGVLRDTLRRPQPEMATPPEGGVAWTGHGRCGLLEVGEHPVDGGLDLLVGQRRIAALGRHDPAVRAGVALDRVLVQRFGALGDARGPVGLVHGRGIAHARGMAAGAQVAEDHRAVHR